MNENMLHNLNIVCSRSDTIWTEADLMKRQISNKATVDTKWQ